MESKRTRCTQKMVNEGGKGERLKLGQTKNEVQTEKYRNKDKWG